MLFLLAGFAKWWESFKVRLGTAGVLIPLLFLKKGLKFVMLGRDGG